jgi:glycosyltransferase involved in cell wall biosynthesis
MVATRRRTNAAKKSFDHRGASMIRVAFVVETIERPTAGMEKQVLQLLHRLNRDEFEPTLICLHDSDWLRQQRFPFRVEILNLTSLLSFEFWRACVRFWRLHRRYKFDVVQVFTVDANYFGTVAARLAGIRKVISARRDTGYWQQRIDRTLLRVNRWMTPYYLANSLAAASACAAYEGVDPARIHVIYNGLETGCFVETSDEPRRRQRKTWGVSDSEILFGCVANLRPVKNLESLVDAAVELCRERQDLRFVVVGEGESRSSLQERIERGGIGDRFHLVGTCGDVVSCLKAFDVGVLCSRSESFSNSLMEYMAAGLPIAASSVGGVAELIEAGESGLVYDAEEPGALERTLRQLLEDRDAWPRLGAAARTRVFSLFSLEACVSEHEDYYRRVVGKQEPRTPSPQRYSPRAVPESGIRI